MLEVTINEASEVNVVTAKDKLRVLLTREAILKEYKDVFEGLGHIGICSSFVVNPDYTPVQHAPRGVAVTLQKEVKEKTAEMEKKGIIQKVTANRLDKQHGCSGKTRKNQICLDPHNLNKAIQGPKYRMPSLEEVLPQLNKAKVFATLDAKDGLYQIGLDEASRKKTTFWSPFGRYRYLRMPFGISLPPEEIKHRLHEQLSGLNGVEILSLLQDRVTHKAQEAEANHDENLKLNSKKMTLKITQDGLKLDPDKVKVVKNMPKLKCNQQALSLLSFYRNSLKWHNP